MKVNGVVVSRSSFTARSGRVIYTLGLQLDEDGIGDPLAVRFVVGDDGQVPGYLDRLTGDARPSSYQGRQEFWLEKQGLRLVPCELVPVAAD